MLDNFCFLSKNLYNHANYLVRQEFIEGGRWIRYARLDKTLKADMEYQDYKAMPTAQCAQQTLRLLDKNWKSFFQSLKDWKKNKEKYTGKPNLPKYKSKSGRNILILTNQNVKLKEGILKFPKSFNGFELKLGCVGRKNFAGFNQMRFVPKHGYIIAEAVYSIYIGAEKPDNQRYCSIDIGIDNLAAVTTNAGYRTFIINGRGLKSVNRYYDKQISHYREAAKRTGGSSFTKRMAGITAKRNRKIDDYMHKASRYIVNFCASREINTIVIGCSKDIKKNPGLNSGASQSFTSIPVHHLIEMVKYKAQEAGINVILTEEAYTSGTSYLDNEMPVKQNYDKSRRVHRGLFISKNGTKINADINAAYQILKKIFPAAYANGIEGVVLHPVRINAACI